MQSTATNKDGIRCCSVVGVVGYKPSSSVGGVATSCDVRMTQNVKPQHYNVFSTWRLTQLFILP